MKDAPAAPPVGDRFRSVTDGLAALEPSHVAELADRARRRTDPGPPAATANGQSPGAIEARPLVVQPDIWARWEAGVAARVALLEQVAADVHGPQQLVARGLLPPELVWGDASLIRTARGRAPVGGRWLVHAAVDVGVDTLGGAMALGDDTATFAGLGHTHENRLTSADLLPGFYARAHVRRLVPFLDRLRVRLAALAPPGPGPARVVILSPPRADAAHDDAAYLARTLGYTLAEGSDLTVRRGTLHLWSLSGLEPVRVVLRLLADLDSDPLELDPGSASGTTGLVAAHHRGVVALANPIGTGWLMNPALHAFLPAIGRALRDDDGVLPGPTAWWCGAAEGLGRALAQLGEVLLYPLEGGAPVDGRRLDAVGLAAARARIEREPRRFVALLPPQLAPAPEHAGGSGPGGPVTVTRLFALADDDGVTVAPGGLTRLVDGPTLPQWGGTPDRPLGPSLDTWVLEEGPGPSREPLRLVEQEQVDFSDSLPSRAGESLYWLGRYAERAEAVVRLADVVAAAADDVDGNGRASAWPTLLAGALDELTGAGPSPAAGDEAGAANDEIVAASNRPASDGPARDRAASDAREAAARALHDRSAPRGLARAVGGLVASAAAVRELLSPELFRAVGDAADNCPANLAPAPAPVPTGRRRRAGDGGAPDATQRLLRDLAAVAGLAQETMVRGPGWHLLDAGRRMERALALLDVLWGVLRQRPVHDVEAGLLEALLAQSASLIAYRRRYRSDPELSAVLALLLVDDGNPRSLRFQLDALADDLARLPDGGRPTARGELAATARQLADRVARLQPAVLARPGPSGEASELVGQLAVTRAELVDLASALHREYIAQVTATRLPTGTSAGRLPTGAANAAGRQGDG